METHSNSSSASTGVLWPSTLQRDVFCSRGCPPRMQQRRLSSQDAAEEAVLPGCSGGGCPPRMQQRRLSSQDAAEEAVLPGCSRGGYPPRMQQRRLSSQDAARRHSRES
ncbi:hypothetical protein OYC64_003227 [Pagothenia borchgrevinki]|uniref:Uncharacterized protein n=1 Tax=Pagothenia borchgrevinki TaxID=8213 RepID=A0ABD2FNL5_PAGBO